MISKVEPRQGQPRTNFDDITLQELAESIERHGIIQPITVRPLDRGYYQIIAGERRWRAARLAGLLEVPITIIDVNDKETEILSLIENVQRQDLDPIEEALAYRDMMQSHHLRQEDIAVIVGKPRSSIANSLRLLNLPSPVQRMVQDRRITTGHAKHILSLPSEQLQIKAAQAIEESDLTVRQTMKLVERLRRRTFEAEQPHTDTEESLARRIDILSQRIGYGVKVKDGKRAGKLILEYNSPDEREALIRQLAELKT